MKYLFRQIIFIFCFVLLFFASISFIVAQNTLADFETYLEEQREDQFIEASAILIFKEDQILYEKYVGRSDIEQNIPLENDHLFLLASMSKVFTGTALLQLYEQELFDLDDCINDYLPFTVAIPDFDTDITFRMLLVHTSGLADGPEANEEDHYYYEEDSPETLHFLFENYFVANGEYYHPLNFYDFEPGTIHKYSNMGSALIGLLVENVSGIAFNTYCKQNIFQPLGMTHTSWRLDEIEQKNQTIVIPYNCKKDPCEVYEQYTFTDYPNGGLRSTCQDVFRFLSAFAQNGTANNHQLLKATTIDTMAYLHIPDLQPDMGLHLYYLNPTHQLWGHDGGESGASTIMGFNRTTKIGAIVLVNQEDAELDSLLAHAYRLGKTLAVVTPPKRFFAQLFLEGSYQGGAIPLRNTLRTNNVLPMEQPYNKAPWEYAGQEKFTVANPLAEEAVDWMFIEIYDATMPVRIHQAVAILQTDGTLRGVDGLAGVPLQGITDGTAYRVIIRHRNHLDVETNTAITLPNFADQLYDFTTAQSQVSGQQQLTEMEPGVYALQAGDLDGNGLITVGDFNKFVEESGTTGYLQSDCSLDQNNTIDDFNFYQFNASAIGVKNVRY